MIIWNTQIIMVILIIILSESFAQSTEWTLQNGKASRQKKISIPNKTANEIYKDISRWLVKYYRDPEENLKARVDGEYIRGVGYHSGFVAPGALAAADLQYGFMFEVGDQEVIFKITDVVLLYYPTQDTDDGVYRIEDYLKPTSKRKNRKSQSDEIVASLTQFSNSLFQSFESYVLANDNK